MRLLLLALAVTVTAAAQHTFIVLDPGNTKINFTLGDVLHTVHGTFTLTKGELWLDPSSSAAGGLLVVNGRSGQSGNHTRDDRMRKNILEAQLFPEITFAPDRIEGKLNLQGHSEFKLHGTFTIHGSGHELTMKVKSEINGAHVSARADFSVPYVQWGMKNPSTLFLKVNETVPIDIDAQGVVAALKP